MSDALGSEFFRNEIGICLKDAGRKVLFQNDRCKQVCGDVTGPCGKGCMLLYKITASCPEMDEGAQLFADQAIHGGFFDVVIMNSGKNLLTLLYPLASKYERELEFLKHQNLSDREREILCYSMRGITNQEIGKKLFISKATVKTHLNNIYKKLDPQVSAELKKKITEIKI